MQLSTALLGGRPRGKTGHTRFTASPAWSIPVTTASLRSLEMGLVLIVMAMAAHLARVSLASVGFWIEAVLAPLLTCEIMRIGGGSALASIRKPTVCVRLLVGSLAVATLLVAANLAIQGLPPRAVLGWSVAWSAVAAVAFALSRMLLALMANWLSLSGRLANKVAVLGDGQAADAVVQRFQGEDPALIRVRGRYSTASPSLASASPQPDGSPARGDLSTLLLDCRLGGIDAVVLAAPPSDAAALTAIEAALKDYAIDVYMLPKDAHLAGPAAQPAALGHQAMLLVIERPLKHWRELSKSGFDRLCAAVLLAMIAPVLAMVAILIRIDTPGPILFRQLRVGYNNQLFRIFKFRTMHAHATDHLATTQTTRGDVRVTRVGRVLRKFSIDELPQLMNVLLGNMSLVGPRPHAPGTSAEGRRVDLLIDNYARRHLVKPGITGLAQVRGFRGGMTTAEQVSRRVQCDLEYIRRQSLWLDIKIMVMTVAREVRSGRAF